MPLIMTKNAIVNCPHGGTGQNVTSQNKYFVKSFPVLIDGDRGIIPPSDCKFPPAGPPCTSYELNSMKLNSTFIDGKNIMLVTDFVISNTGFPLILSETHFVEDNASLNPGETPTIPSFLLNLIKPIVSAAPPFAIFKKSAPTPLSFVFSVNSAFPFKWKLTKLSNQEPDDTQDFTNSTMVTPGGGEWKTNTMSINLVLEPVYLQDLSIGKHHFVMAGIDERGNSDYATANLVIGM
jgi:hypothetical protein